jgi:hypothetical protein
MYAKIRIPGIGNAVLLAGILLTVASATVTANSSCHDVEGSYNIIPVSGADCDSPSGICGKGTFTGGIKGDYISAVLSTPPTPETSETGFIVLTAEAIITSAKIRNWEGDLVLKEAGAFHPTGNGEFVELFSVSGTEDFAEATGVLTSMGTFNPVMGGEGVYQGQICIARKGQGTR